MEINSLGNFIAAQRVVATGAEDDATEGRNLKSASTQEKGSVSREAETRPLPPPTPTGNMGGEQSRISEKTRGGESKINITV